MSTATAQLDLGHLRPAARRHALEDDDTRIRRIRSDRFVPFNRAVEALALFEELLTYPKRTCMPNCLVHADAGMGKTMLAEKFRRDHPAGFDEATGVTTSPVLYVQMPPTPDEGRFYAKLLAAVGAPIDPRATLARKEALVLSLLPKLRPGVLMIDEVQHLLSGSYRQQRQALNLVKFLGNELRVPIVALGTQDALQAISNRRPGREPVLDVRAAALARGPAVPLAARHRSLGTTAATAVRAARARVRATAARPHGRDHARCLPRGRARRRDGDP